MKTFLLLLLFPLFAYSQARNVLEWDLPPAEQLPFISGYEIYKVVYPATGIDGWTKIATATGSGTNFVAVELAPGPHRLVAVSVGLLNEKSVPSEPLDVNIPAALKKLRVRISMQASDDLLNWTELAVAEEAMVARRQYRMVLTTIPE